MVPLGGPANIVESLNSLKPAGAQAMSSCVQEIYRVKRIQPVAPSSSLSLERGRAVEFLTSLSWVV